MTRRTSFVRVGVGASASASRAESRKGTRDSRRRSRGRRARRGRRERRGRASNRRRCPSVASEKSRASARTRAMADASQLPRRIIKVRVDGARARDATDEETREGWETRRRARRERRARPRGTLTDDDDARARGSNARTGGATITAGTDSRNLRARERIESSPLLRRLGRTQGHGVRGRQV